MVNKLFGRKRKIAGTGIKGANNDTISNELGESIITKFKKKKACLIINKHYLGYIFFWYITDLEINKRAKFL